MVLSPVTGSVEDSVSAAVIAVSTAVVMLSETTGVGDIDAVWQAVNSISVPDRKIKSIRSNILFDFIDKSPINRIVIISTCRTVPCGDGTWRYRLCRPDHQRHRRKAQNERGVLPEYRKIKMNCVYNKTSQSAGCDTPRLEFSIYSHFCVIH